MFNFYYFNKEIYILVTCRELKVGKIYLEKIYINRTKDKNVNDNWLIK